MKATNTIMIYAIQERIQEFLIRKLVITSLFEEDPPCLGKRGYQRHHLSHEHYQKKFYWL